MINVALPSVRSGIENGSKTNHKVLRILVSVLLRKIILELPAEPLTGHARPAQEHKQHLKQ